MKQTILLTGRTGQIGSQLHRLLMNVGEIVALDRNDLDLLNADAIRRTVRDLRPKLIINAAGYTAVDAAETDKVRAYAINAEAPAHLAEEARNVGAMLVHYSTDYVFDGLKRTPYTESDPTNPINIYGKTKLVAGQAVRDSGALHLVFRTSWVYATRGRNFLLTILRLATEHEELKIVRDQVGAPTCAEDIAAATIKILTNIQQRNSDPSSVSMFNGTYHMTAAGQTTWYDYAKAILEEARAVQRDLPWLIAATHGRELIAKRVLPISTQEFRSPARRPAYSVLSNWHLTQTFGVRLPNWREQLQRCFVSESIASSLVSH